jgi:hypothetical protein
VDLGRQVRNALPYATGGTNGTSQITARANIGTPDLVATDFTGADLGVQVNAAFASFGAGKCGTVAIPAGTFTYSTTIYVPTSCSLSGAGPGDSTASGSPKATRLVYTGPAATTALAIMNPDETSASNTMVSDLSISSGLSASCPNNGMLRWNAAAGGTNKWQCWDGSAFTSAVPQLAGIRHGNVNPTLLTDGTFNRIVNVAVDGSGANWPSSYGAFHFGVMLSGCEECVLDQVRASGADDGFAVGPATNGVLLNQATSRINKRSGLSSHFFNSLVCQHCLFESNGLSAPSSDPTKYGQGIRLADDDTGYGAGLQSVFIGTYFENNLVDVFVPSGESGIIKVVDTVSGMDKVRGNFAHSVFSGGCGNIDPTLITISGGSQVWECSTALPNDNFNFTGGTLVLTDAVGHVVRKIKAAAGSGSVATFWELPEGNNDRNLYLRTEGPAGTEGLRLENYRAATTSDTLQPSAALWLSANRWNGSQSVKRSFYWQAIPNADGTEKVQLVGPDVTALVNFLSDHRLVVAGMASQTANLTEWQNNSGAVLSAIRPNGMVQLVSVSQSQLGAPPNGTLAYCSDCLQDATCSAAGTGALAKRIAGAWKCN